ncbi:MAG: Crp/Fnr family transcriptional regulator [Chitinophagales bacterium]|nr:Crp/Fnr family transcriptional regulator [Chitinophagales bacterium]MCB9020400.1 Crp/Fnr family transcriptional regulator [Chitinophagales bacterium]MCB9020624.1 Crp/Fnr family transcriptional regulator [Chitinophagales bacterium]HPE98516.1 Crp/Fnr family transcriptional regulator [Chitinophagales bacterium]HQU39534.1 Crp/Fnr family transcriptional regulator [Chitinophagales bacterium]
MKAKITVPDCEHCKNRSSTLFHFCHTNETEVINENKTCALYKKGQVVFHEGANSYGLYCLNSGKVKLYKMGPDGKEQILKIVTPGDFIGYGALLSSAPYRVTAEVIQDAVICFVPKEIITQMFKENPNFSEGMVKLLTKTLDETVEKMADIAYKPVRGRIAEALLILKETYKDDNNPDGVINITREDLASYVGTVKETAIRVLKDFKEEGLIVTESHSIKIIDPKGLTRVCELYD